MRKNVTKTIRILELKLELKLESEQEYMKIKCEIYMK